MSGIGDYIHYAASNYRKSGIYRLNQGTYSPYDFDLQKERIKAKIKKGGTSLTSAELEGIKNNLGYILSNHQDDAQAEQEVNQIRDKVLQRLQEETGMALQGINWETGNISISGLTTKKNALVDGIRKVKNDKNRRINTIYKRILGAQDVISQIEAQEKKEELDAKINNIKKNFANILDMTQKAVIELNDSDEATTTFNQIFKKKGFTQEQIDIKESEIGSLVEDLNACLIAVRKSVPINSQKGKFFEYLITGIEGMALTNAEDAVSAAVTKVIGDDSKNVSINMDNFSQYFDPYMLNLNIKDTEDGLEVSAKSKEKIDVELTLSDGRTTRISAKNVNLYNKFDISVVDDTNLLFLLQDQESNFVNHYLNLISAHTKGGTSGISTMGEELSKARKAVKLTILWNAMSGDMYGRKTADLFIINNNKKKGADSIGVYDMSSLISKAAENMDAFVRIKTSAGTGIESLTYPNTWEIESFELRIAQLLADIHATKISAAISKSLFESNM